MQQESIYAKNAIQNLQEKHIGHKMKNKLEYIAIKSVPRCEFTEDCERISDLKALGSDGVPDSELLRLGNIYKTVCNSLLYTECNFRKMYLKK